MTEPSNTDRFNNPATDHAAAPSNTAGTLYLLDGSAYIYRAYHAIRAGLTNSKGLPTNAIFGFTKILTKMMTEKTPAYLAVSFDMKGPTFRHDLYTAYKSNRPPMPENLVMQLPYIKKVVRGFNIPILEVAGFEADDVIGTLARQAEAAGFTVVIVTGDKDFFQLVTEKTSIWDPMKDTFTDLASLRQKFGVEPLQMIDVMGLSGDTSDNIPGVPGIGPKTALTLIHRFGTMEDLYQAVETVTQKKQQENLVNFKDQAFLSRDLVTIRTNAPVRFEPSAFERSTPDAKALSAIFKELDFQEFHRAFSHAAADDNDAPEKRYTAVLDARALTTLVRRLAAGPMFALDTETTALDPMRAELVGISVALEENEAYYIPVGHRYIGAPDQLPRETVLETLRPALENPAIRKIGQNLKYDWIVLDRCGIRLAGVFFDTMVASYLIDPSKRAHNLDRIALDLIGHKTTTYEDVAGKGKCQVGFDQVLLEKAVPYACEDADITLAVYGLLHRKLEDLGMLPLMETIEVPLIPVLKDMEMRGIAVDRDKLISLSRRFQGQLAVLESEIYDRAGERFNINSPQQLGEILFDKLRLPVQKKTKKKTGYSTDVEVLTSLAEHHELPAMILRHRTLTKLKSTYADALVELIHPETGRIHTSYNQTVAATGRLSSSEPNLQNIPIRTEEGVEIRSAFVPREGWTLVAADYSQIELRLLAHYSNDAILIEAFREEEDIHSRTAAEIFQIFPQMITPELRRQAKTINFGIIYGMGAFSLSKELGISRKMAQTYINNYFARYKGVRAFIDQAIASAEKTGMTSTLLGRLRQIPEIRSANRNIRGFAERTAVNTPIQGTAADLIKLAMIRIDQRLKKHELRSAMLLTVHDELVFEVPPEELEPVRDLIRDAMENVWPALKIPLKVNIGIGQNWAEAH